MPDDSLPTYTFQTSSDNPNNTILYYTHDGSQPSADYLIKRPAPAESRNKYALGLLDVQYASVIYAEVLLKPDWAAPTLSAAEMRAQNGTPPPVPLTPESFAVSLYNPDQSIAIKRHQGSFKTDSWEFEMPEHTFKQPSASRLDQDTAEPQVSELVPKVLFRWKRDGRLNKDMTCYMSGKSVGGKKNKEPDITVALYHSGRNESSVTIYEPNMARVGVEDMKGLEVVLLLSAEVIRDLYLSPRADPFNTGSTAAANARPRKNSRPSKSPPAGAPAGAPAMSGALNARPASPPTQPAAERESRPAQRQQDIDAETKRLRDMVAEEERQARERRDQEEQQRIKDMLDEEERQRRRQQEADVEAETERLRREYGVEAQAQPQSPSRNPGSPSSPPLPPRPNGGWYGPPGGPPGPQQPARLQRPQSVGPGHYAAPPPQQQQPQQSQQNGGGRRRNPLQALFRGSGQDSQQQQQQPYSGPAAASSSGFFNRDAEDERRRDDERRRKVQKKRSVHF